MSTPAQRDSRRLVTREQIWDLKANVLGTFCRPRIAPDICRLVPRSTLETVNQALAEARERREYPQDRHASGLEWGHVGFVGGGGRMRDGVNGRVYAGKLNDPRWQRVRLDVFQRDNFACRCCARNDIELHAHHSFYEAGREPWEYPLESIITYCHNCHEAEHGRSFAGDAGVLHLLRRAGFALTEHRLEIASAFSGESGQALTPQQVREIGFIVAVLTWAKGDTWQEVLRVCEDYERRQPRFGQPSDDEPS